MRMKIWVAIILALAVMCLAGSGSAEGAPGGTGASGNGPAVSAGSIVTFGRYEQDNNRVNGPEAIEWIVLDVQGNRALLLSRYALDSKQYHGECVGITWEQCALRTWLNTDFLNTAFSETEQAAIPVTHVDNSDAQRHRDNYFNEATGGNDTEDRIFLLSYYEAFEMYFTDKEARRCAPTDYAIGSGADITRDAWYADEQYQADGRYTGKWWLRTPGVWQSTAQYVATDGTLGDQSVNENRFQNAVGVRPALWINLGTGYAAGDGNLYSEPDAGPEGGETGVPVTGENRPGESGTDTYPAETAKPAEDDDRPAAEDYWRADPTRVPQPAETEKPAEDDDRPAAEDYWRADPTRVPQPAETASPAADDNRPAEPTRVPQPAETAPPAVDDNRPAEPTREPQPADNLLPVRTNQIVTLGRYEQDNNLNNGMEPIEWIVLDIQDGKALLLSRYGLDSRPYHTFPAAGITWKDSSLRAWLNGEFLNTAFNTQEQQAVVPTDLDNSDSLDHYGFGDRIVYEDGYDDTIVYTIGGEGTRDCVFLLSSHEACDQYFQYYDTYKPALCEPTKYAVANGAETHTSDDWFDWETGDGPQVALWWLRTTDAEGRAMCMDDLFAGKGACNVNEGGNIVRPAVWISLDSGLIGPADHPQPAPDQSYRIAVGSTVTYGRYEQDNNLNNGMEPIEWTVLDVRDEKALLLSRYILDAMPYNTEEGSITWMQCTLRNWLNHDFMNTAFSESERSAILAEYVDNSAGNNSAWTTDGGNDTREYVFLLSLHEAFDLYFTKSADRKCTVTEYTLAKSKALENIYDAAIGTWWLRSPGFDQDTAQIVNNNGYRSASHVDYEGYGVRPAMWVSLDSGMISPTSPTSPADETPAVSDDPAESGNADVRVGSFVAYGSYEQDNNLQNGAEPIEWMVLDVRDGKALLLSRYGLDNKPYNTEETADVSWKNCSLRTWLNSDFVNTAFSGEERKSILLTDVNNSDSPEYEDHDSNEDGTGGFSYSAVTEENTQDYVFLLSFYEVDCYFLTNGSGDCKPTEHAISNGAKLIADPPVSYWWLRTAGTDGTAGAIVNNQYVFGFNDVMDNDTVVRPAVWISLESADVKITSEASAPPETSLDAAPFRAVGNIVTFGRYEQDNHEENGMEPIEWIVLDVRDGKALLLSRYALEGAPYNQHHMIEGVTWETCTLRSWLNSFFLNTAFSKAECSAILTTEVDNSRSQGCSNGADGGRNTQDKVFLLSYHEAYDLYFTNDEARICALTDYISEKELTWVFDDHKVPGRHIGDWWLRSPSAYQDYALYVLFDGTPDDSSIDLNCIAVRPAMWVDLEADIF